MLVQLRCQAHCYTSQNLYWSCNNVITFTKEKSWSKGWIHHPWIPEVTGLNLIRQKRLFCNLPNPSRYKIIGTETWSCARLWMEDAVTCITIQIKSEILKWILTQLETAAVVSSREAVPSISLGSSRSRRQGQTPRITVWSKAVVWL